MVADEEILLCTLNLSSVCYVLNLTTVSFGTLLKPGGAHIFYSAGLNANVSFYLLAEILLIAVRRSKPFFNNVRKI